MLGSPCRPPGLTIRRDPNRDFGWEAQRAAEKHLEAIYEAESLEPGRRAAGAAGTGKHKARLARSYGR